MVQNVSQTGIYVQFYQASTMSLSTSTVIPNQYLPPECGVNINHRCGILHFEHNGISYYILPSIRGFIKLFHRTGDAQQEPQKSFINITQECNPVRAFLTGPEGSYRIVIACMDLQTRPHGVIYYLQYYFSPDTGVLKKSTSFQIRPEPIYDPDTASKVIYVRGQERCAERRNLYFIDDAYVLQYPPDAFDPEYIPSNTALQDCIGYQDIEHYHGNDNLLIRCSNKRTIVYDSCTGRFNYSYSRSDHIPYPCSNWDTIVYRDGRRLTLHKRQHAYSNDTQQGTLLDGLTYGACIQASDSTPAFIGITNDGAVFVAPFSVSNAAIILLRKGNEKTLRTNRSVLWDQPIFSENRQVFGVYSVVNKELQIVNVTAECTFVRNISVGNFTPNLVSFIARNGSYTCDCQHHSPASSAKWLPLSIPAITIGVLIVVSGGVVAGLIYLG